MPREVNHITQLTCRGSCRGVSEALNPPFSCPLLLSPFTTVFATSISLCSARQTKKQIISRLKYLQLNLTSDYEGMTWVRATDSGARKYSYYLRRCCLETDLPWMTALFLLPLRLPGLQPLLNRDFLYTCTLHPTQWCSSSERDMHTVAQEK